MTDMLPGSPLPPDLFAMFDPVGPLEAAVLFKRNGKVMASWTKAKGAVEIVSVMAATLMGSVDTLLETLGGPSGSVVVVLAERRKIYLQKVEPASAILLVAPSDASDTWLREMAQRILARLPPPPASKSHGAQPYHRGR